MPLWFFCLIFKLIFLSLLALLTIHTGKGEIREGKFIFWFCAYELLSSNNDIFKVWSIGLEFPKSLYSRWLFSEQLWNYLVMRKNIWCQGDPRKSKLHSWTNPCSLSHVTAGMGYQGHAEQELYLCLSPGPWGHRPPHHLWVSPQLPAFDLPQILHLTEFFFFSKLNCLTFFLI